MKSLIKKKTAQNAEKKNDTAQCCAKVSVIVAGCHD